MIGCGVEAVVFTDCAFFILGMKSNSFSFVIMKKNRRKNQISSCFRENRVSVRANNHENEGTKSVNRVTEARRNIVKKKKKIEREEKRKVHWME
jgi:hypothetical protein